LQVSVAGTGVIESGADQYVVQKGLAAQCGKDTVIGAAALPMTGRVNPYRLLAR
jgi:hypothetical protein